MDRGETVGSLYGGYAGSGGLYQCNVNNQGDLVWSAGKRFVGGQDDEYAEVFYDSLTARGYKVVGDPRVIFDRSSELSKAKFLVWRGRLLELKMNLCALHSVLTDNAVGKEVAEVYAKVEWSVYSPVEQKTVYKVITEGYQNIEDQMADGFTLAFLDALGVAAENLAADQGFYELVSKNTYVDVEANKPLADEAMALPKIASNRSPFSDNADPLLNSVVHHQAHGRRPWFGLRGLRGRLHPDQRPRGRRPGQRGGPVPVRPGVGGGRSSARTRCATVALVKGAGVRNMAPLLRCARREGDRGREGLCRGRAPGRGPLALPLTGGMVRRHSPFRRLDGRAGDHPGRRVHLRRQQRRPPGGLQRQRGGHHPGHQAPGRGRGHQPELLYSHQ